MNFPSLISKMKSTRRFLTTIGTLVVSNLLLLQLFPLDTQAALAPNLLHLSVGTSYESTNNSPFFSQKTMLRNIKSGVRENRKRKLQQNQSTINKWDRERILESSNDPENESVIHVFHRRVEDEEEYGSDEHATDQVYLDVAEDNEYLENIEPLESYESESDEEGTNIEINNVGSEGSFEIGENDLGDENSALEGLQNEESYNNEDVYYLNGMQIVRESADEGYEEVDTPLVNSTGITSVENYDEIVALNTVALDENYETLGEILNATEELSDDENLVDEELSPSVINASFPVKIEIEDPLANDNSTSTEEIIPDEEYTASDGVRADDNFSVEEVDSNIDLVFNESIVDESTTNKGDDMDDSLVDNEQASQIVVEGTEDGKPSIDELSNSEIEDTILESINTNEGDEAPDVTELLKELTAEEREVRWLTALSVSVGLLAMIFTAWQMSENPDGLYALLCRLSISVIGCIYAILTRPLRKFCGYTSPSSPYGRLPLSNKDYGLNDPSLMLH